MIQELKTWRISCDQMIATCTNHIDVVAAHRPSPYVVGWYDYSYKDDYFYTTVPRVLCPECHERHQLLYQEKDPERRLIKGSS